ncbi:MAG: GNAT family N-acetyltransferase [Anaerolineae bacterium]|nr:GNAT family N-acetyltransferase [Anaerolineae bacterium]
MSTDDPFAIVNTREAYADALAAFQHVCYPTLPESDLFTAEDYCSHVRIFPDGQFTALLRSEGEDKIVAATTTMRADFGELPAHFMDFIGHNTISTHKPDGAWLYGIDMSVHPAYRRLGLSRRFYDARAALVRRLKLRGEFVAGLLPGYERVRTHLRVEDYVAHVVAGKITDPTLTPQLRSGFRVERLLYGYVVDPRSDDVCTLLVRENPDLVEA